VPSNGLISRRKKPEMLADRIFAVKKLSRKRFIDNRYVTCG
jgi:hypothetical protein